MKRITRTIKKSVYTCLVYDPVEKEMNETSFTLDKEFDLASARKILQKKFNGDTLTVVDVIRVTSVNQLYEISIEDFMKYAKPVEK